MTRFLCAECWADLRVVDGAVVMDCDCSGYVLATGLGVLPEPERFLLDGLLARLEIIQRKNRDRGLRERRGVKTSPSSIWQVA